MSKFGALALTVLFTTVAVSASADEWRNPYSPHHHKLLTQCKKQAEQIKSTQLKKGKLTQQMRQNLDRLVLNYTRVQSKEQFAKNLDFFGPKNFDLSSLIGKFCDKACLNQQWKKKCFFFCLRSYLQFFFIVAD